MYEGQTLFGGIRFSEALGVGWVDVKVSGPRPHNAPGTFVHSCRGPQVPQKFTEEVSGRLTYSVQRSCWVFLLSPNEVFSLLKIYLRIWNSESPEGHVKVRHCVVETNNKSCFLFKWGGGWGMVGCEGHVKVRYCFDISALVGHVEWGLGWVEVG